VAVVAVGPASATASFSVTLLLAIFYGKPQWKYRIVAFTAFIFLVLWLFFNAADRAVSRHRNVGENRLNTLRR
jgi:hypothetical protein